MPCLAPIKGWRAKTPNPSGKYSVVFTLSEGWKDKPQELPCGQCRWCRIKRTKAWAVRMMHEASLHEDNCFVTLTYSNERMPIDGNLNLKDFQDFMKRLREKHGKWKGNPQGPVIKFYHCGEYGEHYQRPHYHACLFNFDFKDKKHYKTSNGQKYYRSEELERLWPYGMSMVGDITYQSAAYVAGYIQKKITGKGAKDHYNFEDPDGDTVTIVPEYATMSRAGGIGLEWFKKYKHELHPDDFVIMKGKKVPIPKYYDDKYDEAHPDEMEMVKTKRKQQGEEKKEDNTWERLKVKKEIMEINENRYKRDYRDK